jgi:hypothetical protein
MASTKKHTRVNPDPAIIPTLSDPEKLIALRNIIEILMSSARGNHNLDNFPPSSYGIDNYDRIFDTPLEAHSIVQIPNNPLIYFHNSPLCLSHSSNTSYNPFLKNPRPPLSFEANNLILNHLMDEVGGGIIGGNQTPPPPPVNPWVEDKYGPLNIPQNTHELPKNYLKSLPKYDGKRI